MIKSKQLKVKVPISPMIDIIFLMIFFFVVSFTMDQGLNETIDLVKVNNIKPQDLPPNKVFISVNETGDILLDNGSLASEQRLKNYLTNVLATWGKSTKFVIRADKDVLHRDLDTALQRLKESGAKNIVISGEKN
ncbi:MAG: biopolymer transporter ExbD [Lentisphaeraceae bacterium]|nr:biopolymer transporter ExbD [Lentisphaeraceae bacterium]